MLKDLRTLFISKKQDKQNISCLTAYDFPTAKLIDDAGIDLVLVGDSVGNVVLGYEDTLPVTIEVMIHHAKAVRLGLKSALMVVDMPRASFVKGIITAVKDAKRIMDETKADAVKIEGTEHLEVIKQLVASGIPVMGHIGYTPQTIRTPKITGRSPEEEKMLLSQARILQDAGVFSIVLELVAKETAKKISESIKIPTIGIGSGPDCNGQVLVLHDMIGLTQGKVPGFVKQYADLGSLLKKAVKAYIADMKGLV